MEEDIKILEEKKAIDDLFSLTHINGYINLYELKKATIYTSDLKKWQNGVKVLLNQRENLIKGYRELEIENQSYRDYLGEPPCYDNASYIPKSKIKEKIEELESKIKATFCKYMTEEDYYNNKFLSSDVAEDYEVLEVRKLISNRNLLQELMEE